MNFKIKLILMMMLLVNVSLFAQDSYSLTGIVSDIDGNTLIGVNVLKANSSTGAVTDIDGRYQLNVTNGDVVEFSYVGYATQSITITGQKTLDITLTEDIAGLGEVVVVGYGTVKKSDVTGAVSSIKSADLTAFPVLDAAQALQRRRYREPPLHDVQAR